MPREWIDRGTLLREYWKKQKSKQMTRLEELEATRGAAYAASKSAYYVAFDVVAADARHDAYEATQLDWVVADDAYQAELKKAQQETPMTKLEELKATVDAAYAAAYAADEVADEAAKAAEAAYAAAWAVYTAYEAELKKTQKEQTND